MFPTTRPGSRRRRGLRREPPKTIAEAAKLAAAADQLVADIEAETEPELALVAVKDVKVVYDALVGHAAHDTRQAAARTVQASAHAQLSAAWDASVDYLLRAFQPVFNECAEAFTEALARAGSYNEASGAQRDELDLLAAPLTELKGVRDILGARVPHDVGHTGLKFITRVLRFTDLERALRLGVATEGTTPDTAAWWAAAAGARGVTIAYNLVRATVSQASSPGCGSDGLEP